MPLNATTGASPPFELGNIYKSEGSPFEQMESYHKFLNVTACHSRTYGDTFWRDMKGWLTPTSKKAAKYPKAPKYRGQLAPYLLRRVTLTVGRWAVIWGKRGLVQLCLRDVRLSSCGSAGVPHDIRVKHMNVVVDQSWLDLVTPSCGYHDPLLVDGLLYEYVSSAKVRNIGVWPVALVPCGWEDGPLAA